MRTVSSKHGPALLSHQTAVGIAPRLSKAFDRLKPVRLQTDIDPVSRNADLTEIETEN
jgi:hypothetical protein